LRLSDCVKLNYEIKEINKINSFIIEKELFLQTNNDVFNDLGKFPETDSIKVKDDAISRVIPPRREPYKLLDKLKETLDRMCKLKVVEKCSKPSEWQSPKIIIEKPDKSLKVCFDLRELNNNIIRERYQILTLAESKLS
jgi:hypothetical protein